MAMSQFFRNSRYSSEMPVACRHAAGWHQCSPSRNGAIERGKTMAQKATKPHRSDLLGALTTVCALAGASFSTSAAGATAAALAQHALQFSAVSHAALMATNRVVSSCADDGGAGTLRNVVAGA